jgi:hypothetical protein
MGELERMLTPSAPPPEPENMSEIVYVSEDEAGSPHLGDRDFNVKAWMKKVASVVVIAIAERV